MSPSTELPLPIRSPLPVPPFVFVALGGAMMMSLAAASVMLDV